MQYEVSSARQVSTARFTSSFDGLRYVARVVILGTAWLRSGGGGPAAESYKHERE